MSEQSFDVVVVGGGSAGYAAALRSAQHGRSVAVVERDKLGGTCLHRGCVPTKALLHAGTVAQTVRTAADLGVRAHLDGIDVPAMMAYRDRIVSGKHKGLRSLVAARGITVIEGTARVEGHGVVRVGDDVIHGHDIVIATGARSRSLPSLPIGGRVITSDEALDLDAVPEHALILGGGVIGVEFASLWQSLGAQVTVIEALPHLAPNEDVAMSRTLERAFSRRGIEVSLGVRFASAVQDADGVTVTLEDDRTFRGDVLLVAVGRSPATDGLGLEEAGVVLERGWIRTDARLHTDADGIWAAGDVVRGLQLAHRGFAQGIFVADQIAGQHPVPVPDEQVPRVTYCSPEIASVGLTQAQAEERFGKDAVSCVEFNLAGNARSEILGAKGLVKAVRRVDGPVVGVHVVGDGAGEMIAEAQLVVGWDAHPEDVTPFLHAHPTQGEALGEAFLALAGRPLHAL